MYLSKKQTPKHISLGDLDALNPFTLKNLIKSPKTSTSQAIMTNHLLIDTSLHWVTVLLYIFATIFNTWGLIFKKPAKELTGYRLILCGISIHSIALLYRWIIAGHGPYIVRYEILSSMAWMTIAIFLLFRQIFPAIKPGSIIVYPATFLLIALGVLCNPELSTLPPTLTSIWLVIHVVFYKLS